MRDLRRRCPDAEVHTLHLDWDEPHTALLDHRVDAAVARPPFPTDHLDSTVLFDEQRVLDVPRFHLAGRQSVTLDDIADEPSSRLTDPDHNAYWRVDPRPDARPAPGGPLVEALEDKLELVAGGQVVAVMAAGVASNTLRQDLTTIPMKGMAPSQVVLATRANEVGPLMTAFGESARTHLTGRWASAAPGTRDR